MEKTNNKISVKTLKLDWVEVPVMRNGKPTKRTKTFLKDSYVETPASGYIIEGHEVFITDEDIANAENPKYDRNTIVGLYRKDGSRLTCECKYGRYGTADHRQVLSYDMKNKRVYTSPYGWNGATWKGAGATIKRINW